MGQKRNHEIAARIAWAAKHMIGNTFMPHIDDEQGWALFEAAEKALQEYGSYMYGKGH